MSNRPTSFLVINEAVADGSVSAAAGEALGYIRDEK